MSLERKRLLKAAGVLLGSLALMALSVAWLDIPHIRSLKIISHLFLGVGIISVAGTIFLLAMRWRIILSAYMTPPAVLPTLTALSAISFLSMFLPKEIMEFFGRTLWLKKKYDIDYVRGSSSVFMDRLLDLMALAVTLIPAICFIYLELSATEALCVLLACTTGGLAVVALSGEHIFSGLNRLFLWVKNRINRLRKKPQETISLPELSKGAVMRAFVAALVKFLLVDVYYWAFLQAIGPEVGLPVFILIVPFIQLIFIFSFTVGGMGFVEFGWYATLSYLETDAQFISAYLLAQRLFLIIAFAVVLAIFYACSAIFSNMGKERTNYL